MLSRACCFNTIDWFAWTDVLEHPTTQHHTWVPSLSRTPRVEGKPSARHARTCVHGGFKSLRGQLFLFPTWCKLLFVFNAVQIVLWGFRWCRVRSWCPLLHPSILFLEMDYSNLKYWNGPEKWCKLFFGGLKSLNLMPAFASDHSKSGNGLL